MKEKSLAKIAVLFLLLAVVLGAFGAHGLKQVLTVEKLTSFNIGIRYQFYHGLAILILLSLSGKWLNSKDVGIAGLLFSIGILLFSGSIYLLSCNDYLGISDWKFLGPITPIGGMCFIAGWTYLLIKIKKVSIS